MNNILLIGTGGCGGKLLDSFITLLNNRDNLHCTYDYVFTNSNKDEMEILDNCRLSENSLVINGGGTGRNRDKAISSISKDRVKVTSYFGKSVDKYQAAIILLSADGGWGSGSITLISKVLKQINPDILTFCVIADPKLTSKRMSLENTLSLYGDIKELMNNDIINSYIMIDNDKMDNEEEFNIRTMSLLLNSLELGEEALDGNDSLLVNFAKGYKVILPLSNKFNKISDAIDDAMKNSPFVLPTKTKCTHIYGTYNPDDYSESDILSQFNVTDFDKLVASDSNFIVMNGFKDPDKHMATINTAYEMLNEYDNDDEPEEEFTFNKKKLSEKTKKEDKPNKKQRLRSMMDDSFWG